MTPFEQAEQQMQALVDNLNNSVEAAEILAQVQKELNSDTSRAKIWYLVEKARQLLLTRKAVNHD